jgi:hypothetical protein
VGGGVRSLSASISDSADISAVKELLWSFNQNRDLESGLSRYTFQNTWRAEISILPVNITNEKSVGYEDQQMR